MRNRLIENNLNLVWHMIHDKFRVDVQRGAAEDLFQVGCIGLIKAADTYNADRGIAFTTYACRCIWSEVMNYKRDNDYAVHIPDHIVHKLSADDRERYKGVGDANVMMLITDQAVDVEAEALAKVELDRALSYMPRRAREIAAVFAQTESINDAAKACGCSRQRVCQCRDQLRIALSAELEIV